MNTTVRIITLTIVGIIAASSLAYAGSMRGMRGDCPAWSENPAVAQLPQEKQDLLQTILDEHRKETEPMRNAMWEKRTLLRALSANPSTKPETLSALVAEMSTLRAKMLSSREALEARVQKEVGIDLPRGFGRQERGRQGHGMGGHGPRAMGANWADGAPDAQGI